MPSIARGSVIILITTFLGFIVRYVLNVYLGWALSPEEFGIWGVSIASFVVLSIFVSCAFPPGIIKYLSEGRDFRDKYILFKSSLLSNVFTAVGVCFFSFFVFRYLGVDGVYLRMLYLIFIALLLASIVNSYKSILQGSFRFKEFAFLGLFQYTLALIGAVLLINLGFGVYGAFSGHILAYTISLVMLLYLTKDFKFWKTPSWSFSKGVLFGVPVLTTTLLYTLLINLDILSIKLLTTDVVSDTLAGYYQAALVLGRIPFYITIAFVSVLFPFISRYSDRVEKLRMYVEKSFKFYVLFILPYAVIITSIPGEIITLVFPSVYQVSSAPLAIISIGMGFFSIAFIFVHIFQAMGKPSMPVMPSLFAVILDIALISILVPEYGIAGAAIATTISCVVFMMVLTIRFHRLIYKISVKTLPALKTSLSLTVLFFVLRATPMSGKISVVLGVGVASLIYLAMIVSMKVLMKDDIELILEGFNLREIIKRIKF